MASTPFRSRRIVVACGLVVAFMLVIVRLVNLQVMQSAELTVKADRQHQKNVTLEGARGTIYDRNSKVLAMNMDVPSVFGVPTSLGNPGLTARNLSPILHVKATELEKKLKQDKHFVWLARKLEPEQGRRLERLALDGVGVVMEGRRFYPKGPLLSHVLGFAGMDDRGLEGVELRYEQYLRGAKRAGKADIPSGLF